MNKVAFFYALGKAVALSDYEKVAVDMPMIEGAIASTARKATKAVGNVASKPKGRGLIDRIIDAVNIITGKGEKLVGSGEYIPRDIYSYKTKEVENLKKQLEQALSEKSELEKRTKALQGQVNTYHQYAAQKAQELQKKQESIDYLVQRRDYYSTSAHDLLDYVKKLRMDRDYYHKVIDNLEANIRNLKAKNFEISQAYEKVLREKEALLDEIRQGKISQNEANKKIEELSNQILSLETVKSQYTDLIKKHESTIDRMKNQIQKLETEHQAALSQAENMRNIAVGAGVLGLGGLGVGAYGIHKANRRRRLFG